MNMVNIYVLCELVVIALMLIYVLATLKHKNQTRRSLRKVFIGASITVLTNVIAISVNDETLATFFYAVYFASTSWLVVSLFKFLIEYSYGFRDYNKIKKFFYVFNVIDTILLLINTFNNYLFYVKEVSLDGVDIYAMFPTNIYFIHLIYIYALCGSIVIMLLIKIFQTPNKYKPKYVIPLFSFSLIIVANVARRTLDTYIDYSVILYGAFVFSLAYYIFYKSPKKTQNIINDVVVSTINDTIIAFDYENHRLFYQEEKSNIIYRDKIDKILNDINKEISNNDIDEFLCTKEYKIKNKKVYIKCRYRKLTDNKNKLIGYYYSLHDITEEVELANKEKEKIAMDTLTKIYNKEYFIVKAEELINSSDDKFYIVYTDIKNFKLINDIYGKDMGDKVLVQKANTLRNMFKNEDKVVYARISNDNFAICLTKELFNKVKLEKKLNENNFKTEFKTDTYVGVYKVTDKSIEITKMLDYANIALKAIKNDYTEHLNYYNKKLMDEIIREQKVINNFKEAIANNEFKMYLQPQISNESKKVIGAESLARWIKDDKIVPPKEFVPILEKYGLITELDIYIWENACIKLEEWKEKNIDKYISINISPNDFYYVDVYKTITDLVSKYNIDRSKLKLEITESVFINDVDYIINTIDKFRDDGYIVEMDDFGSGYSSLNLLKNINVDVVKLDMLFLYKAKDDNKSKIIIETLVDLFKKLGVEVVSEGVETKNQLDYLSEIGCDVFQGYYFDKPISIEEFEDKYKELNK